MASIDQLEFAIVLHRELNLKVNVWSAHHCAHIAHRLIRAAASLHKRYEAACSYEWACTEAYEHGTERKEAAVTKLLAIYGLKATFGRDPRGASISLKLPSGLCNGFCADGYSVPGKGG